MIFVYLPATHRAPGTRGDPGAAPSREGEPEPRDTWRPQSCPESGAGVRAAGTRGGPGAAPSWEWEPMPQEHVTAPELPRAGSMSPSRGDTWRPRSCPQPKGRSRCLDLKLVRGGTRSSGYRHATMGKIIKTRNWTYSRHHRRMTRHLHQGRSQVAGCGCGRTH
jgi:hypothetical protein